MGIRHISEYPSVVSAMDAFEISVLAASERAVPYGANVEEYLDAAEEHKFQAFRILCEAILNVVVRDATHQLSEGRTVMAAIKPTDERLTTVDSETCLRLQESINEEIVRTWDGERARVMALYGKPPLMIQRMVDDYRSAGWEIDRPFSHGQEDWVFRPIKSFGAPDRYKEK